MRSLHVLGLGYIAVCGGLLLLPRQAEAPVVPIIEHVIVPQPAPVPTVPHEVTPLTPGDARAWFETAKPFCNTLEVVTRLQFAPPPGGTDGAGYGAACYALAGRIDSAAAMIDRLDRNARPSAAGIVFEVGHPVADAGDNRSAGPIMALVVSYQPDNYMALYHAGMAEAATGDPTRAKKHLRRFLELYHDEDGWRSSAIGQLRQLGEEP